MQIQLMRCTAEPNRVNKESYIQSVYSISGTLKEEVSIMKPVIMIEKPTPPMNSSYNYMYIPAFRRYYFITDIRVVYNGMWEITGREDVLYSNMADIYNNMAIISKAESANDANLYLNDGSFVMDSRKLNQVFHFPGGLSSSGHNILIVAGGSGS